MNDENKREELAIPIYKKPIEINGTVDASSIPEPVKAVEEVVPTVPSEPKETVDIGANNNIVNNDVQEAIPAVDNTQGQIHLKGFYPLSSQNI